MMSVKKNVILNVIKQICTIVFPLITFPYAVHILGADNYGMYSFSNSIISYISLIATLGVTNYAIREGARIKENKQKISKFVNEVFTINLLSTAAAYIILFLLLLLWHRLRAYTAIIVVLSFNILFNTLGTDWINSVFEDYEYITKRHIICNIISMLFLFVIVKSRDDIVYYAFAASIGNIGGNIMNFFYIRKKIDITPQLVLSKSILSHLMPVFILFANSIATTIYINSDITILGLLKDDYNVGIYSVSSKIYFLVKGIINAAIAVIIPRISYLINYNDKKNIDLLLERTLSGIILITVPAIAGLVMLSDDIIMIFAGKEFSESGRPMIILSFALIFAVMACFYINGILIPFRNEKKVAKLTVISAASNIVMNFILIPFYGYIAAAITTLISEFIMFLGGLLYSAEIFHGIIKRDVFLSLTCGTVVVIVCSIVKHMVFNSIFIIIICVLVSVMLYLIILCSEKNNIIYMLVKQIKDKTASIIKSKKNT